MANNKAIVAIAHKLLVVLWYVLNERVADKHANSKMAATKLMRWSWELTEEQQDGRTTRQFIRCQLMRSQLGQDLTHIRYGNISRWIASLEEVLALKPELARQR